MIVSIAIHIRIMSPKECQPTLTGAEIEEIDANLYWLIEEIQVLSVKRDSIYTEIDSLNDIKREIELLRKTEIDESIDIHNTIDTSNMHELSIIISGYLED